MIGTKESVCKNINGICRKNIGNVKYIKSIVEELKDKYNIPEGLSFDILTLKKELIDETDNILFAFVSILDSQKLTTHFTKDEIKEYSKWKYKKETIKYPIKIKSVEVSTTQWIGKINVKELMQFRNAQLINYNENAQRRLKRVISGNEEWYQIDINREAVNGIMESYRNEAYIPNTITLNMPEDTDFYYDGEYLNINSISAFDILDGYHRYIGMSNIYNLDSSFDYTMELRIVQFSEDTAKQFIWQEDQKTKMSKIDSDALNQYDPANNVVDRLNTKSLKGIISRNNGIIDNTTMSQLVKTLWFNNTRNKVPNSKIIEIRDYIYHKFEVLLENDSKIFDKRWTNEYLGCAMILFAYDNIDEKDLLNEINALYKKITEIKDKNTFLGRTFNSFVVNRIKKVYEGEN